MTTIHSTRTISSCSTAAQDIRRAPRAALVDDPRRPPGRQSVGEVIPALKGKLDGFSMRVRRRTSPWWTWRPFREEGQARVNAAFRAARPAAQGHPGRGRRAARSIRLPRQPQLLDRGRRVQPRSWTRLRESPLCTTMSGATRKRCVDLVLYMASRGSRGHGDRG